MAFLESNVKNGQNVRILVFMNIGMMRDVAIITGGAGGIGFATAKIVGLEYCVVLADMDQIKLESAVATLREAGIQCDLFVFDVTNVESVQALFEFSSSIGVLGCVIHTAGVSLQMTEADTILSVNAIGTANIIKACLRVENDGFALVNVASMAAYMFPSIFFPRWLYPLAKTNPQLFLDKMLNRIRLFPGRYARNGIAYAISKNYVTWASKKHAASFGDKGARLLSVSPGTFDTEMGRLEVRSGSARMLRKAALKRFGQPEEIAELLAFCASKRAGYLTGIDILCDGGVVSGRRFPALSLLFD
jgi:NAD(P)-dependent dehydrogenase (short-subunit alcohol dehydrogenase family)